MVSLWRMLGDGKPNIATLKMDQLRCVLVTLYNKDPCLGKLDSLDEHNFRMSTSVFAETAIALIPLLHAGAPRVTLHLKHFGANQ